MHQSCQSLCTSYQEMCNILLIQINRFIVSNLHGRPQKNNHPFGIYENIKLGLINYTLLGLIEHHGVFIDSGHYVSYINNNNNNNKISLFRKTHSDKLFYNEVLITFTSIICDCILHEQNIITTNR